MPLTLPVSYDPVYDETLRYMYLLHAKRPRPVASFWPRVGAAYQAGGLMVVSRTVPGWRDGFETHDMENAELRARITADRRQDAEAPADPMVVLGNSPHPCCDINDASWQIVPHILARFAPDAPKDNWKSQIVWTALAKIGFADGGSPSEALWYQQQDNCRNLFKIELETFKPGFVLILADDKSVRDFRLNPEVEWNILEPFDNIQILGESPTQKWVMIQQVHGHDLAKITDKVFKLLAGDDDDDDDDNDD